MLEALVVVFVATEAAAVCIVQEIVALANAAVPAAAPAEKLAVAAAVQPPIRVSVGYSRDMLARVAQ